jgi:hypothetical protein
MTSIQSNSEIIATSSVLCGEFTIPDGLSADGMLVYLQTRLGSIDSQIEELFVKQQKIEGMRKALADIQKATAGLGPEGGKLTQAQQTQLSDAIKQLAELDPTMAENLWGELRDAGCYEVVENAKGKTVRDWASEYTPEMASQLKEAVGSRMRSLESGAEIDMLRLQSLMSTRTQVITAASNCMATLSKGPDTICSNL